MLQKIFIIILLIPSVSPLIGDRMGFQGLKWKALIGLETKNGKNKMEKNQNVGTKSAFMPILINKWTVKI